MISSNAVPALLLAARVGAQRSPGVAVLATTQGLRCCLARRRSSNAGTALLLEAGAGPGSRLQITSQTRTLMTRDRLSPKLSFSERLPTFGNDNT